MTSKIMEKDSQISPGSRKRKFSRPTVAIKHRKVLDKLVENGGNMSKAIRDTGLYSPSQELHPEKIIDSKTWKEVVEDAMPDSFLLGKHKELFEQKEVNYFVFPKTMSDEEIVAHVKASGIDVITVRGSDKGKLAFYSLPNANAMKSALEMAYRAKGVYGDIPQGDTGNKTTYNFIFSAPVQEKIKMI